MRTDHTFLQWLKNFKEPYDQTARWLEILERFDYKIMHKPGKRHGNADGLSRQRWNQCGRWPHSTEPDAATTSSAYYNNPVVDDDNFVINIVLISILPQCIDT
jgi:hypothetical protein